MTTQTEALKLALEALESCDEGDWSTGHVIHPSYDEDAVKQAMIAIEEALAQPEQEPAFYGFMDEQQCCVNICYTPWAAGGPNNKLPAAYYTAPPQPKEPEQEPVASNQLVCSCGNYFEYEDDLGDWTMTVVDKPKEPEQEPVAWMLNGFPYKEKQVQVGGSCRGQEFPNQTPLYTTPPQRKPLADEQSI